MEDLWLRVPHDLAARLDGPPHFRFILQPLMSILIATRDGLRDARNGDRAYLWSIFIDSHRRSAFVEGRIEVRGATFSSRARSRRDLSDRGTPEVLSHRSSGYSGAACDRALCSLAGPRQPQWATVIQAKKHDSSGALRPGRFMVNRTIQT